MAKTVWQNHHINYKTEEVVRIRRSVHYICTKIQRHTLGMTKNEKYAVRCALRSIPTRTDLIEFEKIPEEDLH